MGPEQPVLGCPAPAHDRESQKVVEAAAVDPCDSNFRAFEQAFKAQRCVGGREPIICAAPSVGVERESHFDVQVLRRPAAQFLVALVDRAVEISDETLDRYRLSEVRHHHRPEFRVEPRLSGIGLHRLRELVQHRQHAHVFGDPPVADAARVLKLCLEHARRWFVRLRGDENQHCLRVGDHAAPDLPDDPGRIARLRQQMELVDQHGDWLGSGHHVHVEGLDLDECLVAAIGDLFQVVLHLKPLLQIALGIRLDHARRLRERQVGDFLRRRRQDHLGARPFVLKQQRDDHRGAAGRLRILLRHQRENLGHHALSVDHGPTDRPDDISQPLTRGVSQKRLARDVRQAKLVEYLHSAIGLFGIERKIGQQGAAALQPFLPIRAGKRPSGQLRTSPQLVSSCPVAASMFACSFLPIFGSFSPALTGVDA